MINLTRLVKIKQKPIKLVYIFFAALWRRRVCVVGSTEQRIVEKGCHPEESGGVAMWKRQGNGWNKSSHFGLSYGPKKRLPSK